MRAIASVTFALALIVSAFAAARGHAQEPQSILPALLTEVRGLRTAMEQMASAGPRVQLALGRLQLQEQRLSAMIMKLDATREKLADAQRQLAEHQQQWSSLEGAFKAAPNVEERGQAEHMLGMLKAQTTVLSSEIQRLTAEESSLAADIASEQGRWNDFNQRLEELERALGGRR
jgi:predicted  nucleic acid-binding Zn-ribbon protein